uniref:Reverse transcriptase RNase H-like domain-containing protein n=1 Tax=Amphimedon queenslandica TaxID=400682 RepID=A0A1X7V7Y7_AMPQE
MKYRDMAFILQTDASGIGVGAFLSQSDDVGLEHPIAYFSRKLLLRGIRYSTGEQECLAIKLGIEEFFYLLSKPFLIQTALQWMDKFIDRNNRLMQWSLGLQPLQFKVVHRKGRENTNADTLSRM